MLFTLLHPLASLLISACMVLAALNPRPRWLYLAIILFPLANVYVAGLALAGVLLALLLRTKAIHVPLARLWWFPLLWGVWLLWTIAGFVAHGLTVRQVMQTIEFVFYGGVATMTLAILRSDSEILVNTLRACLIGSFLLACLSILAAAGGGWPEGFIGPNESSFIMVIWGIVPAIALGFGLSFRPHTSQHQGVAITAVLVILVAIVMATGRGAMLASLFLLSAAGLFTVCRRDVGQTLANTVWLFPVIAGLAGLFFISGAVPGITSSLASFSNLERLALVVASYNMFLEAPVVGWGFGRIDLLLPFAKETLFSYKHPHNTYARFAVEMGIGGLLFLTLLFARMIWHGLLVARRGESLEAFVILCSAGALMTLGMVGVVFYGANRAMPALLLMAIVEALPPTRLMLLAPIGVKAQA